MKVALCIGHNKKYQGAVGSLGISEWEYNKELTKDIQKNLKQIGIESKRFFRPAIKSYAKQIKELNKQLKLYKPNLSIEFHFNAAIDADANGHEVLYYAYSIGGKEWAKVFDKNFDLILDNRDRDIRGRLEYQRGGRFLASGREVRLILEPFFAAHQQRYKYDSVGYWRLVGAIVSSIYQIKIKDFYDS